MISRGKVFVLSFHNQSFWERVANRYTHLQAQMCYQRSSVGKQTDARSEACSDNDIMVLGDVNFLSDKREDSIPSFCLRFSSQHVH
jgi:hypothetical protein